MSVGEHRGGRDSQCVCVCVTGVKNGNLTCNFEKGICKHTQIVNACTLHQLYTYWPEWIHNLNLGRGEDEAPVVNHQSKMCVCKCSS